MQLVLRTTAFHRSVALSAFLATCGMQAQVVIQFDYSLDSNSFFSDPSRKTVLESAATAILNRLQDSLTAITPGGANTWTANFSNPGTGAATTATDLSISAGVLKVYAGGYDLPGSAIGIGGPGGFSASGSGGFLTTVSTRGQSGAPATEFGPWGGSIAFDTLTDWYFDSDVSTLDVPGAKFDFYSVAVHELAHLLGVGTANSWNGLVSSGQFVGATSVALHGGNVNLASGNGHWADGTTSTLPGTAVLQEVAMDPTISNGQRKFMTDLDFAGLSDVGWQVAAVPEPRETALATGMLLGLGYGFRRWWLRTRRQNTGSNPRA